MFFTERGFVFTIYSVSCAPAFWAFSSEWKLLAMNLCLLVTWAKCKRRSESPGSRFSLTRRATGYWVPSALSVHLLALQSSFIKHYPHYISIVLTIFHNPFTPHVRGMSFSGEKVKEKLSTLSQGFCPVFSKACR